MKDTLAGRVRFGQFELDLRAGELREGGRKVVLQDQPFQVLRILVEYDGRIVTREEIQSKLWPNDTIVEFDHGINTAIRKLRVALGDSAESPKYIETVARRGYRLMVPVERMQSSAGDQPPSSETSGSGDGTATRLQLEPAILTGKTVSHYRVLEIVGGGGMGVVYRAEDVKLGRSVALKFLPEDVGKDPRALERFEREARAASALDHSNLCSIYEFGEHEGRPFIVMQLLQGQTLRDRLAVVRDGPGPTTGLGLDELLQIAIQVTNGLEAAHEKGIIHRDIKPANVFITDKGVVKILDFGLAKLAAGSEQELRASELDPRSGAEIPTREPSEAKNLSRPGIVLGTAAYMSPEQVRGENLDARTDLFSFGLILYEMATGQQAFRGSSAEALHDAILNRPPSPALQLNPELPSRLEAVIGKCLQKKRDLRYQGAAEIRADLEKVKQETASPLRRRWKLLAAVAVVVVALIAGSLYWRWHTAAKLSGKDTVVLADFENRTGETVFDGTLRQGLQSQLEQSTFLALLSDRRIGETLSLMAQPKGVPLTRELAREVCQRTASAATIEGSISSLGSQYVLGLKAVDCRNGDLLANEQVTASSKEQVLKALGNAATKLRRKLGESLVSVEKYNKPLEEATTSSLEALKAYSAGMITRSAKGDAEAVPLFQRAVELDPNFAMAHARLGIAYVNLSQPGLAAEQMEKAYQLRDSASEKEKLYISAHYYSRVTGDINQAKETDLLLRQIYPRELSSYTQLQNIYATIGNYDLALAEAQAAVQLDPGTLVNRLNLCAAYINLNRFAEAAAVLQQAEAHGVKSESLQPYPYLLAFFRGDAADMARQVATLAARPGSEAESHKWQSDTAAYFGRLAKAREFARLARELVLQSGATETAALWQLDSALQEAEIGDAPRARQAALQAVANSSNSSYIVHVQGALALARSGDRARALALTEGLERQFPSDTILNHYWLPTIRAALALDQKNPQAAIEALQPAAPYELGSPASVLVPLYPVYLRGLAYLEAGQGKEAVGEFQKMLAHRGIIANFPTAVLAHLQLGRAQGMVGDRDAALKSYQDFFSLWKDADPDLRILRTAKTEYAKLQEQPPEKHRI